jgi:hypothetical protein
MGSGRIGGPKFLDVCLAFWLLLALHACQTLRHSEPAYTLLRTDSAEIVRGVMRIGMVLVNTTQNQISGGCLPNLERKVNDKWVTAHFGVMLGCNGLTLKPGQSYRDSVPYFAANIATELRGAPIEGIYRLRWRFVEGRDASDRGARKVEAISNEFHLSINPSQPECYALAYSDPIKDASARLFPVWVAIMPGSRAGALIGRPNPAYGVEKFAGWKRIAADSLELMFSGNYEAISIHVARSGSNLSGRATWLSDYIEPGPKPSMRVDGTRESCPPNLSPAA